VSLAPDKGGCLKRIRAALPEKAEKELQVEGNVGAATALRGGG
jgi:hypothetical protein